MKAKYTTEGLQRKIGKISEDLEVIYGEGNGLPLEACRMIEELITAQQQALIEEIEKDLQKLIVQVPADKWRKGHNDGLRSAISTLEAIKKEMS